MTRETRKGKSAGTNQQRHASPRQGTSNGMSSLPRETTRPPSGHMDWRKDTAAFLKRYAHIPNEAVVGARVGRRIYGHAGIEDPRTGVQYQETYMCASHRTCELRGDTLFRLLRILHEAGLQLRSPWNLQGRHIQRLLDQMKVRFAAGQLSSASIAQDLVVMSWWSAVVGQDKAFADAKARMDPSMWSRSLMAKHDKTWEGNQIDIGQKLDEAWHLEPFVAMALLAQYAFGLRRLESLMFRPKEDVDGDLLRITRGAKGGRPRVLRISSQWQWDIVDVLKEFCTRGLCNSIGDNGRDLATNLNRYKYVLGAIGVTKRELGVVGHGLRAGFACRMLDSLGVKPPVWGGSGTSGNPEQDHIAYSQVSAALGHSRLPIVGAYVGTVRSVNLSLGRKDRP